MSPPKKSKKKDNTSRSPKSNAHDTVGARLTHQPVHHFDPSFSEIISIIENHKCGYDCFSENSDGISVGNGTCKYDIAAEVRRYLETLKF